MTTTYETGAKTHGANNLILSVLNDSAIYETRKHSGFALLVGINTALGFSELVNDNAKKQRLTGSKFSAYDIKEAKQIIINDTIKDCIELIKESYEGGPIKATCRCWWDKVNGNSYFSVNVNLGKYAFNIPFKYGYDNQYKAETEKQLSLIGISADKVEYINQGFKLKKDMFTGFYLNEIYIN
jgi:hypothetical protein